MRKKVRIISQQLYECTCKCMHYTWPHSQLARGAGVFRNKWLSGFPHISSPVSMCLSSLSLSLS